MRDMRRARNLAEYEDILQKIVKLQKKGRSFLATMEDGSVVKLSELAVFDHALAAGKEFDDARWTNIKNESDFHFAWDSAMRILSARARSEGDLRRKLRSKGFADSTVEKVMNECRRLDLMDDAKFAEMYLRELRSGGAGLRLIKMKLREKGVSEELVDRVLEEHSSPDDEIEAAKIAFSKKARSFARETDPRKRREKIYRHLASKGFSFDVISQVCEESGGLDD